MAKPNVEFKSNVDINQILVRAQKSFRKAALRKVAPMIRASIERGVSPVAGEGRFEQYSDSYKEQMVEYGVTGSDGNLWDKKPRPVNLTVSAGMLKSLKITLDKMLGVVVTFTKKVKGKNLAAIHNNGDGVTERRLLPTVAREKFNRPIQKTIEELAEKAVKFQIVQANK